jgi:ABC-type sugar transport system substrate-binding protein
MQRLLIALLLFAAAPAAAPASEALAALAEAVKRQPHLKNQAAEDPLFEKLRAGRFQKAGRLSGVVSLIVGFAERSGAGAIKGS